jgi:hypothetical protein
MELMNTRMSPPFILSGLAKHMDVVIINKRKIIYNKPLESAKTIFIFRRQNEFNRQLWTVVTGMLDKLPHAVNVIIAGSDATFPNNVDNRFRSSIISPEFKNIGLHPRINKLFVENLDEDIPKTTPIPLGLNPTEGPVTFDFFSKFINIDPSKPLQCTNFNRLRKGSGIWEERKEVFDLCETAWKPFISFNENTKTHEEFLDQMGKSAFTICVHGGGLDVNPKLWEALLIGVIPIIRENKPYTDIYIREDMPVVIVKGWTPNTITPRKLKRWHKIYYRYFTNPQRRERMLTQLSLDYWVKYVSL